MTSDNWVVAGLRINCLTPDICMQPKGANNFAIRNNWVRGGAAALAVVEGSSNGTIEGNIYDGPGGTTRISDWLRFKDALSNILFTRNWVSLDPSNTANGNDLMTISGIMNTTNPLTISHNLFESIYGVEQAMDIKRNQGTASGVVIAYNTFRGPHRGQGAGPNEAAFAINVSDAAAEDPQCHLLDNCPLHRMHHNYFQNSYSVNSSAKAAIGIKAGGSTRWNTGLFEFNVDHNGTNADTHISQWPLGHDVVYRRNTHLMSAFRMTGNACDNGRVWTFDDNVFHQTRIVDNCPAGRAWVVTDNVFSQVVGGGFQAGNQGAGNAAATVSFASTSDAAPDFTILGTTHSQKGALPVPTIASAQIGNDCKLNVTMTPYNGLYNHGPISRADAAKITVKYGGVAQGFTLAPLVGNVIPLQMAACPNPAAAVTLDATHGWCEDSANIGGQATQMNAQCLAVTGRAVVNDATVTGGACDTFFGSVSGYSLCEATDASCSFNANLGGGTCRALCDTFNRDCLAAVDNVGATCEVLPTVHTCDTVADTEICMCSLAESVGVITQTDYQFYRRGEAAGVQPARPLNTPLRVYARGSFTARLLLKALGGDGRNTPLRLFAQKCNPSCTGWILVTTASNAPVGVYIKDHPQRANREVITSKMPLGGAAFENDGRFIDADNNAVLIDLSEGAATEVEYSLGVSSAAQEGDSIFLLLEDRAVTNLPRINIHRVEKGSSGGALR
jgi:hypothetical protein